MMEEKLNAMIDEMPVELKSPPSKIGCTDNFMVWKPC